MAYLNVCDGQQSGCGSKASGRALCVSLCVLWLQGLQHERRAVSVMGSSTVVVTVGVLNSPDFQQWLDRLIMTSLWQMYSIQMHFRNNCQLINLILWNDGFCCRVFLPEDSSFLSCKSSVYCFVTFLSSKYTKIRDPSPSCKAHKHSTRIR